ncbi:WD40 repeat-like protein [Suillus weaverae]|nr:WD40 repeat-like protein [Suillus weaverae]
MSFLPTFFNKSVQLQRYKLLTRLTTYSGSVYALAISNDGNLLACGGTEGIKIWDIKSRKELTSSSHHHESRGTVSCAIWSTTRKTAAETLCYGTGLGYIIFLRHSLTNKTFQEICARRLGSGFEITCLSWHLTSSEGNLRIAVGTRDKIVQVLTLNASSQLQSVFAVRLENTVPKSVAFADNRDVYVFGLYDGNFMKLKDEDGSVVQEMSCKSVIGHAAVHSKRGVFVVDNAADGFTLYRLDGDGEPVRTFATAVPSMSLPKQVAFGEEGKVVVGGSDNGLVYVFDRKTGQTLETLHHADTDSGLTRDLHGRCTIASALTAPGRGKTTIKIWAYDYAVQKAPSAPKAPSENYWSLSRILMMLTQLLALLCMSVFLLINYKDSFLDSAVNRVHGYMTSATIVNVADEFSQHVKAAMKFGEFGEYVDIEDDNEGPTEGSIKHDIRMLRELAAKLMEIAQEAGGDIDEDEGKHDTDHPQAAKGDEWTKSLTIVS